MRTIPSATATCAAPSTCARACGRFCWPTTAPPYDEGAIERLDRAASRAGLRLRFHPGGCAEFEPDATGVDGALARLLAIVAEARVEGEWERLKACADHSCQWAFYDKSKNRSKKWCRMEVCGNVAKARSYRARAAERLAAYSIRCTLNRLVPPDRPGGSPAVIPIVSPRSARPASTAASAQRSIRSSVRSGSSCR